MSDNVNQNEPIDLRAYHPLTRLRRIIRAYVVLEGVFLAMILGCVWFWLATALDFGVQYFFDIDLLDRARPVRSVMLIGFGAGMTAVLFWYILRRWFRDFSPASLALVLEKRFPDLLGDRLITAVELADLKRAEKQGYSVEMIVKTMKEAKERVDEVPVHTVFNWRRLGLMAWTLVGVSVFLLLLTYPLSVLVSLADMPRGPELWKMLAVNGLLAAGLACAFFIPCLVAWRRDGSPKWRNVLLSLLVMIVAGTGVGYALAFDRVNAMKMHEYSWRLHHVTDIALDRNFRFMETRWPKDEYFADWLDFPVEEKRIQVNKTINARAYFTTYIIADDNAPKRWRPLKWADLPNVVDAKEIPELPLDRVQAYLVGITGGDERSPVGYDKKALHLPTRAEVSVDFALAAVADPDSRLALFSNEERKTFAALADALNETAADPRLGGRLIRRITPPESLSLNYEKVETKQKGRSTLAVLDRRRNVYGLEQPVQLNEKVHIYAEAQVNGQTVQTPTRVVDMVRAPKVETLVYQEFRPAYYYYLPPTAPRADTIDERRRLFRDLRQALPEMRAQRPPESFTIPDMALGSELVIAASADKKLQEVTLTARNADFPGSAPKDEGLTVPLSIGADGKTFTIRFVANGRPLRDWATASWLSSLPVTPDFVSRDNWLSSLPLSPSWAIAVNSAPHSIAANSVAANTAFPLISRTMTFDVLLKDMDNMTSSRSFTVRPLDDKPPSVSLYVDVIRQVAMNDRTVLLCTAKAEIPFTRESVVADDNGLHKVEFSYEYMPLANSTLVGVRAEMAAWLWASTPIMPSIGDFLYRREVLLRTTSMAKGPAPIKGTVPLESFATAQSRNADGALLTVEQLKERLGKALPQGYVSPVLNRLEFNDEGKPVVFDLRDRLPRLSEKEPSGVERSYELILNVRATDSNVIAPFERTSENKEAPLVFRIVSEDELKSYIMKEEAELVRRFDEMIKKLEANQRILDGVKNRCRQTPSPDRLSPLTAISEQTRVEGVAEFVAKAKELSADVQLAYTRIQREYEVNRFVSTLTSGLSNDIINPLRQVQLKEFPEAELEMNKFHAVLTEGRPETAEPQAELTLDKMQKLVKALNDIRSRMGVAYGLGDAIQGIEMVYTGQNKVSRQDLERLREELLDKLLRIAITVPDSVVLEAGKSDKVTVKLRMPTTLTSNPFLRFEIPKDSGIKIDPAELALDDEAKTASFAITAGTKRQNFSISIVPSQGKPVELKVIVK